MVNLGIGRVVVEMTRALEAQEREALGTKLMPADEKETRRQLLDGIAEARAQGLEYVTASVNGARFPVTYHLVE